MKKGILIIGERESGKSFLSQLLASGFSKEYVSNLPGRFKELFKQKFPFLGCHKNTKIIIIDDVTSEKIIKNMSTVILNEKLLFQIPERGYCSINPKIIINCDEKLRGTILRNFETKYSKSFQLIDTTNPLELKALLELKNEITRNN